MVASSTCLIAGFDDPSRPAAWRRCAGACLEGAGIALTSDRDVWEALDDSQFERIELEDARFGDLGIWAVYPSRQHLPRRIRAVPTVLIGDRLLSGTRDVGAMREAIRKTTINRLDPPRRAA